MRKSGICGVRIAALLMIVFTFLSVPAFALGSSNYPGTAENTIYDKAGKRFTDSTNPYLLRVHFINVGKSDSILIQAPDNKTMLIDASTESYASRVINYIKQKKITRLDYVIGTHPHNDHIGGLSAVINTFDIGQIYMPNASINTPTFYNLLSTISSKGLTVQTARAGVYLDFCPGMVTSMVAPNSSKYGLLNDASAVIKMVYGNTAFLFTGDVQSVSENEMLAAGYNLKADVLKVPHHGNSASSSIQFLNAILPKRAVITMSKDYTDAKEVIGRLTSIGANAYVCGISGNMIASSDSTGVTMWTQYTATVTGYSGTMAVESNLVEPFTGESSLQKSSNGFLTAVVDRFEGNFAVCELDNRKVLYIDKSRLPNETKESDVIVIGKNSIKIDNGETITRTMRTKAMMAKIWK